MSQENIETVKRIVEAFCAADWTTALNGYDESIELDQSRMPGGGIYHGHRGMREFYERWVRSWDHFHARPLDYIDAGDAMIVVMEIRGMGKASGAPVAMRTADVYTVAGGKVVRHVGYPDASQALEAAGLPASE
jgi:ketosteroid isomerase-like protein